MLIHFDSWKLIADTSGMQGSDVGYRLFVEICGISTADVPLRSALSLNLFAAYTNELHIVEASSAVMNRWLPAQLTGPSVDLMVRATAIVVERTADMHGSSLYERAQVAVSLHGDRLPPSEKYPALNLAWEEASGSLGPL